MAGVPRVQVVGPFKSGTSTWQMRFANTPGANVPPEKHHVVSGMNVIFVPMRPEAEIYQAALFQDITCPAYNYYYGSRRRVLNATPEELVAHYHKFDWPSFRHLQYDFVRDGLRSLYDGAKLPDLDPSEAFHISKFPSCTVVAFRLSASSQRAPVAACFRQLGLPSPFMSSSNLGSRKWYAGVYLAFKQQMLATGGDTPLAGKSEPKQSRPAAPGPTPVTSSNDGTASTSAAS